MAQNLPYPPIGHLILLVCIDVDELLQQKGQAAARISERSSGVMSVEKTNNVQPEIALQPHDVHVSSMQDFHNARVGEDLIQTLELSPPWLQSIDDPYNQERFISKVGNITQQYILGIDIQSRSRVLICIKHTIPMYDLVS